jgi:hypothetical protein
MMQTILLTSLALSLAGLVWAQAQKKRASPHETTSGSIGGAKITIEYGRPYKKGREIFGGLEPLGKVWRTGADEATTFTTDKDLMVGNIHVPAGTYGLFTIPDKKEWTLVLNKTAKQWGAFEYKQADDLGRTPMQVKTQGCERRHAEDHLGPHRSQRRLDGALIFSEGYGSVPGGAQMCRGCSHAAPLRLLPGGCGRIPQRA